MLNRFNFRILSGFFIILLILVYRNIITYGFLNFDDLEYIKMPFILNGISIDNIIESFKVARHGYWIPLTWISHMLDCDLYGLWAGGHHLTNFIIHCLNGFILYKFINYLLKNRQMAFWISILFLFHPLQVEPVVWIADRKGLLGTLFYLLACFSYLHYIEKKKIGYFLILHFFFLAGFMSKPIVVSLPLILLLLDEWPLNRLENNFFKRLMEKWTLIISSGIFCLITYLNCKNTHVLSSLASLPLKSRLLQPFVSYAAYLTKTIFPFPLTVFYPHPVSISEIKFYSSLIIIIGLTLMFYVMRRKKGYLFAGWMWFILSLIPMIGVVQAGLHAYADRFMYFPLIGLIIIFVVGLYEIKSFLKVRFWLLFTILIYFTGFTFFQIQKWKTPEILWKYTYNHTVNNSLASINLGCIYFEKNDIPLAEQYFKKALEFGCTDPLLYQNMGIIFLNKKDFINSEKYLKEAILKNPKLLEAHFTLGTLYLEKNDYEKAITCFESVLKISPDFNDAKHNLLFAKNKLQK